MHVLGIPVNCVFQDRAEPRRKKLKGNYRRRKLRQRSFSRFHHRRPLLLALTWIYNDRGECENRIEEFKNGFCADRLSCRCFLANTYRLLLHAFAYNSEEVATCDLPSNT